MSQIYRSTFRYKGKKYKRTSIISQREADRKADQLKKDLENGVVGISGNMTVKRWAQEWMATFKEPEITKKSCEDYWSTLNKTILPAIGSMRISDVTDIHLQKTLNSKAGYSKEPYEAIKKYNQSYV